MLDDTDDILALSKRLIEELPPRLLKTDESFVTVTPTQVNIWNGDGSLTAIIDIPTEKVHILIGEVIDIENELLAVVEEELSHG
ncbi:hypothetical protein MZD04_gp032 [Pseudomonas phage Psa21]|uniref:EAL domain-containing protein n=1 Tax=Pseudomonas phage Psa21 TaxID=2530023 RepID=A0A481W4G8_9CAUD|nr:hypothetical protein MZD04_gp032 [Pseudomonas phage Psa21]QBJ02562.1 hypothetical protein PSA21_32 [Pseudomonas phage Psa21]